MKTYNEVLSESVELNEAFGFGRRKKNIDDRLTKAAAKGTDEENKERVSITKEVLLGIIRSIKTYPRSYLIALGVAVGDATQSSYSGVSVGGFLANRIFRGVNNAVMNNLGQLGILAGVGFGAYGTYRLMKLLVTRGPEYLEAKLATRDNKQLAYTMKKEFGVDLHTQDVRVGSPGRSKIMDAA